jgi:hypothetical protein
VFGVLVIGFKPYTLNSTATVTVAVVTVGGDDRWAGDKL